MISQAPDQGHHVDGAGLDRAGDEGLGPPGQGRRRLPVGAEVVLHAQEHRRPTVVPRRERRRV